MEGVTMENLLDICLCTSLAINLSVFCYFFIFALADLFVKTCHSSTSRMQLAHKHCAEFMRNFYLESVFYSAQGIAAIIVTLVFHDSVLSFETELPRPAQLLLAASLGFHVVAFFRVAFLGNSCIVKYTIMLMQFMVILTVVAVLITKEDAPMGMILLVSETDMLFANVGKLHKVIRLKGTRRYRVIIYVGAFATVLSRAIIPLGYLAMALLEGSPLKMSISATTVFFVGLVACGAINTWRVNSAVARICRKEERIIEVAPYTNISGSSAGPKPDDMATSISANIEMPPSYNEVFAAEDATATAAPAAEGDLAAASGLTFTNPMADYIVNDSLAHVALATGNTETSNLTTFISIDLSASDLERQRESVMTTDTELSWSG
ncbi:uncharacterized protein LOC115922276 [Strongylocentrotus purpuratus]|uniref:Transmembrane protein n=1 Tax=Strongylocentrotus purpuratus TaxID=7668 RepID=A0A7M7NM11_STRPU|nr:uncharacterized protein LOC115922276 [Strongylocentrotus purpuratus]